MNDSTAEFFIKCPSCNYKFPVKVMDDTRNTEFTVECWRCKSLIMIKKETKVYASEVKK